VCRDVLSEARRHCQFVYNTYLTYLLTVRMSGECTELEKSVKEVLNKFMDDRDMYEGIQTSSTRRL
jgi:hypothetical protein